MLKPVLRISLQLALVIVASAAHAFQRTNAPGSATAEAAPSRADLLRGDYGTYRANNDLLSYRLDVRVDPAKKFIRGKNTIRFKMLKDGTRIQMDLTETLTVEKILYGSAPLKYARDAGARWNEEPGADHSTHDGMEDDENRARKSDFEASTELYYVNVRWEY